MTAPIQVDINHAHIFCGIGGGAKGFNRGHARVKNLTARFRCLGGIDVDPAAIRDFTNIAVVPGTVRDLFSREQYRAFHGYEPPVGWREAVPDDVRQAFGNRHPHILFLSAPCKGFSGLLSETASKTAKYQALNGLTLRGIFLALEAYKDDPVELIIFENVPRIATRGRHLLDQIVALLRAYGYAVAETTHDCGELGGLAQSRKRFLLVARCEAKIPNFLYEPVKKRLRGVGEVLDKLPMPLSGVGGPMHRMPALQWKTWVRLAFVKAGSDWRSLNELAVDDGVLRDFGIAPGDGFNGMLGVNRWDEHASVVSSESLPSNGKFAVADPRVDGHPKSVQLGVRPWHRPAPVVTGKMIAGGGPNSVADPRLGGKPRFNNTFRIVPYSGTAPAVAGPGGPAGGLAVADPRPPARDDYKQTKYRVTARTEPTGAVIAASTTGNGAFAVADPRTGWDGAHENKLAVRQWVKHAKAVTGSDRVGSGAQSVADPRPDFARDGRDQFLTAGHYGVVAFDDKTRAVVGTGQHDNGPWSVADPRLAEVAQAEGLLTLPAPNDRLVCVIEALDGTWHRPFTTLELAAIQSLIDPEEFLELDGLSDSAWRERIGNMVPPASAEAIAGVMGRALLGAWSGETFSLSSEPIWVRNVAVALAVDGGAA